jgi:hypothetical protein
MRKRIFIGLSIVAFIGAMGVNVKVNTTNSSIDLTLENLDAYLYLSFILKNLKK